MSNAIDAVNRRMSTIPKLDKVIRKTSQQETSVENTTTAPKLAPAIIKINPTPPGTAPTETTSPEEEVVIDDEFNLPYKHCCHLVNYLYYVGRTVVYFMGRLDFFRSFLFYVRYIHRAFLSTQQNSNDFMHFAVISRCPPSVLAILFLIIRFSCKLESKMQNNLIPFNVSIPLAIRMCTFIYLLFGLALTSMCINGNFEKIAFTI